MNKSITIHNFSSGVWRVSDFTSKILVSTDGLVKMKIIVYPNGYNRLYDKYVSVYARLLSSHVSTTHFSIVTPKRIQQSTRQFNLYWTENETDRGLPQYISHQTCRNVSEGLLNDDKLTIMVDVFCTSLSERQSESLINSSSVNSVEMWYDWTVCNLSTFPDIPNVKIYSGQFPSNSELAQFTLQLGPRGLQNNRKGYISLFLCLLDIDRAGLLPLVNYTFTIRNYGADGEVFYENPFAVVFAASENNCYGRLNFVLYEKAIKNSCLTIELRSVYNE